MVRPDDDFRKLAENYVCVRVTNINDIDFNVYPFDWDLTLVLMTAHPDGTVYHRHGGRTQVSPMSMLVIKRMMRDSLERHRAHIGRTTPHVPGPSLKSLVEGRLRGRIRPVHGCLHCHYVREANQDLLRQEGRWTPDRFWIFPPVDRLGIRVDDADQTRVTAVVKDSPSARAGLQVDDRILAVDGTPVLSKSDIEWVLNQLSPEAVVLRIEVARGDSRRPVTVRLPLGWKIGDPEDQAWRTSNPFTTHMRKYLPSPGFIGRRLGPDERPEAIKEKPFALLITDMNHASALAGVRTGDILISAGHRSDFKTTAGFFRWCELMRRLGSSLELELFRRGKVMRLQLTSEHLNDTRIKGTPTSSFGFTVQQLAGGGGLRVGTVIVTSDAWVQGIRLGDRLRTVEGEEVSTLSEVRDILNAHLPGDVLALELERDRTRRTVSVELVGLKE